MSEFNPIAFVLGMMIGYFILCLIKKIRGWVSNHNEFKRIRKSIDKVYVPVDLIQEAAMQDWITTYAADQSNPDDVKKH